MVGIQAFPFGMAYFQGLKPVSFREGTQRTCQFLGLPVVSLVEGVLRNREVWGEKITGNPCCIHKVVKNFELNRRLPAWRIIPVSKWLGSPLFVSHGKAIWKGNITLLS